MLKRLKRMRTHTAYGNWLGEAKEDGLIARRQVKEIPSPYSYSPVVTVYKWRGVDCVAFETAHRTYDVFELPKGFTIFGTEESAATYNMRLESH